MDIRAVWHKVLTALAAIMICVGASGQQKKFVLVLDPGHGGEDPGAVSGRLQEKTLNLEVVLALGAMIEQTMPDVSVLYTRKDDRSVGLAARGDFANRSGADLFISIHANANRSSAARGSETYVMGADKSEANLEVAKLENEVIRYEQDYTETYAGWDPDMPELSIVFGMLQYANFESSLSFARLVQRQFAASTPLRDRGAKQGPFAVLWKPTMPRVLVEMGFISSESDRRYMFSGAGKEAIVRALYDAFGEYRQLSGASEPVMVHQEAPVVPQVAPQVPQQVAPQPQPTQQPAPQPAPQVAPQPAPEPEPTRPTTEYWVQLAAVRNPVGVSDRNWGEWRGRITERQADGWYKYQIGPYPDAVRAAEVQTEARKRYPGAFIVEIEKPR